MLHKVIPLLVIAGLRIFAIEAAERCGGGCPEFVKRDNVRADTGIIAGTGSIDIDGWYFFTMYDTAHGRITLKPGIYLSPISSYSPQIIAGTETDVVRSRLLDISNDGQWVLYSTSSAAYIIKKDGTHKTILPLPAGEHKYVRFLRSSPYGDEIYYHVGDKIIEALPVNLNGNEPSFGTKRTLLDLSPSTTWSLFGEAMNVAANHIGGRINMNGSLAQSAFFTIPSDGTGTAGTDDMWIYSDLPSTTQIQGCSFTISWDGALMAQSIGTQGVLKAEDPYLNCALNYCVPNKPSGFTHKGLVVYRFPETGSRPMTIDSIFDYYALSVNWVPAASRISAGEANPMDKVDNNGWNWTNHPSYIIGHQSSIDGSYFPKVPYWGIWLCKWDDTDGLWILLTPKGTLGWKASAFISDPVPVAQHYIHDSRGGFPADGDVVYTINGRRCGVFNSGKTDISYSRYTLGIYILQKLSGSTRLFIGKRAR